MNVNIFVGLVSLGALIFGLIGGAIAFRIYSKISEKKLVKHAEEVLSGDRENIIIIDGKKHDATKFIVKKYKDDNETLIYLKGGKEIENGKRKENEKECDKNPDHRAPRQDSMRPRKTKRNIREFSRRFG